MASVDQSNCPFRPQPVRWAQRPAPAQCHSASVVSPEWSGEQEAPGRVGLGVRRWHCGTGRGLSNSEVRPGVPSAGPETDPLPLDRNRRKDPSLGFT